MQKGETRWFKARTTPDVLLWLLVANSLPIALKG